MYKMCKTEQSALRQRQLEAGLLEIMESTPYEDISISDLCDRLGIPRKSFYRYFSGKDGALYALIDHTLLEFDAYAVAGNGGRSVANDLERFFGFWLDHRRLLDALTRNAISGVLIERTVAFALSDDVLPTRFLPDDTREMQKQITTFAVCGLMSMVLTWHSNGYARSPAELARVAVRLLSVPLFPHADTYM